MLSIYWLHKWNKCNLVEYSDSYSKTSGSLSQCYRDKPFLDSHGSIADFPDDDNSALLKFKTKIAGRIVNNCTKNVKIIT